MRTDIDLDAFRARLTARRAELAALRESTSGDVRPVELDQTRVGRLSRIDALQVQAMAQATRERSAQELQRIDAALKRMETGDYGFCVRCDGEIAPARLDSDPAVPTCIDCARGGEAR